MSHYSAIAYDPPVLTDEPGRITKLTGPGSVSDPHQTPSAGSAPTGVAPVPAVARTPGREVETRSPATPSRPGVTLTADPADRVSTVAPFTVDRTITGDDIHLVTVTLAPAANAQLVRDLTRGHIADLILFARLTDMIRRPHPSTDTIAAYHEVLERLVGSLTARATTQWELTLTQADALLEPLYDAATDPEPCSVGTCTGYATTGGYCPAHADGI